jgi:hypothetical protein
MDSGEDMDEISATADIGPHLRTWRMLLLRLRWAVIAAAAVLAALLAFRTHS